MFVQKESKVSKFEIHPINLSFQGESKDLEKEFIADYTSKSLQTIRITLLIASVFYAIFGFLDAKLIPEMKNLLWLIRYAFVIPFIIGVILFSYSKHFKNWIQPILSFTMVVSGIGIIIMIIIAPTPINYAYYAGLILIFMFGYILIRLRFIWASLAGWTIVIIYELIAIDNTPYEIFLNNNFFFISANIIGMAVCYYFEYYLRRDFFLVNKLKKEQKKVLQINNELEQRVVERTEQLKVSNDELLIEVRNKRISEVELKKSQKFLETIIDNIPAMIFVKDTKNLKFIIFNKISETILGLKREEVINKSNSEIFATDSADIFSKEDQKIIEGDCEIIVVEEYFETKNHEKRLFHTKKLPILFEEGKPEYILGISEDITDRNQNEENLRSAKIKAEESDKLKTAFLSNMSHEIRTPMNAIIGFAGLLTDHEITAEEKESYIFQINQNSNALLNLIEDIVDISKIESGQLKINIDECLINKIILGIYSTFSENQQLFSEKNVELKWSMANSNPDFSIRTDTFRLHQILNNLVGNAIKFTEKGSIEFGYILKDSDTILFYVKDTGIGIADDKISYIFDRFGKVESDKSRLYRGAGLGLTISKSLIELLDGEIWVESSLGKGSTFHFTIPINKIVIVEGKAKILDFKTKFVENTDSVVNIWNEKRILIAEDVASNFQYAKAVLSPTGANIVWAKNGFEAVEICKADDSIDLILMDIQMPEINGYEATHRIKSFRKQLPIIALTAFALSSERDDCFAEGCDDYMAKPIKANKLISIIKKYI